MAVAQRIINAINRMSDGALFRYRDLPIGPSEYVAAAKSLERLLKKGMIRRASTGVFFKPRQSIFGTLRPREEELLTPYLFDGGKRIAYVTGLALYNRMGLTTQVPKDLRVASKDKRIITKVGNMQVRPVKAYVDVTDGNYSLLELLDVLKDCKTIPDTEPQQILTFALKKLQALPDRERTFLVDLAMKYPPRVRALLGALLHELYPDAPVMQLKHSLNPLSVFNVGIRQGAWCCLEFWNVR